MEMTKEVPSSCKAGIVYLITQETDTHISLIPDYCGLDRNRWNGRKAMRMPIKFFNAWYNRLPRQASTIGIIEKAQLKPKGDRLVTNPEIGPGEEE